MLISAGCDGWASARPSESRFAEAPRVWGRPQHVQIFLRSHVRWRRVVGARFLSKPPRPFFFIPRERIGPLLSGMRETEVLVPHPSPPVGLVRRARISRGLILSSEGREVIPNREAFRSNDRGNYYSPTLRRHRFHSSARREILFPSAFQALPFLCPLTILLNSHVLGVSARAHD